MPPEARIAAPPLLLAVDDEPINILALQAALADGHQVVGASSGPDALALCRARAPDLVLLDVSMPGMDGHEVCRRLKADPATRDIPVIFVTGHHDPVEEALGLDLGAVDFIAKPIHARVVRARVKAHVGMHRAALQLRVLNETLEQRIADRTEALATAMARADAANRAKSAFLSNISHEIRTPMNSVIGMAYRGLQSDPNPRVRDCLQKIQDAGEHLLGIINDILDVSRAEAGKLSLEASVFELRTVLTRVESLSAPAAEAKGLSLVMHVDPGMPTHVLADPLRLGQVLLNYVGNAIKFSQRGTIRVDVWPERRADDSVLARFEVADEGRGIPAEQAATLFQPFAQADNSTTRFFGGSGLGLAICRQLAQLMGGEAGLVSEPGRGSTFWFTARLGRAAVPPADAATAAGAAEGRNGLPDLRGKRVLVVEDNEVAAEITQGLLEDAGAQVVLAGNGLQCLAALDANSFDLVLMDLQMPVMDGFEATRRIRARASAASLPVLALSASAGSEMADHCRRAGLDGLITKPVVPSAFYRALSRFLPSTAVERPAPVHETPAPVQREVFIDPAVLSEQAQGQPHRMQRYAALFLDQVDALAPAFHAARESADIAELARLAHRVKSSAAAVGARELSAACARLETASPTATSAEAARALADAILLKFARIQAERQALLLAVAPGHREPQAHNNHEPATRVD